MSKWLITGANGNLGRRLISELLQSTDDLITAVVRSARAAAQVSGVLENLPAAAQGDAAERLDVVQLDYTDASALAAAARDCRWAVHLVGVIKGDYEQAHERSCTALVQALASSTVSHITYMSIVGAGADSANACLASKGRAEDILLAGACPVCVLRVPMVLGEGDFASAALAGRASSAVSTGFRMTSLEQPIYAGDVVAAIRAAAAGEVAGCLDLGGPEVLSRAELVQRAAGVMGCSPRILSLPISVGMLAAGILERVTSQPPVSRAMLGVLDHDDRVDSAAAVAALQLPALTSLDRMLAAVLAPHTANSDSGPGKAG